MSGEEQSRPWQSFRDAAAQTMAQCAAGQPPDAVPPDAVAAGRPRRLRAWLYVRKAAAKHRSNRPNGTNGTNGPAASAGLRRRTDLRLAPAALLVWATAAAGGALEPAAIAILCAALVAAAALLLVPVTQWGRGSGNRGQGSRGPSRGSGSRGPSRTSPSSSGQKAPLRSIRATLAAALVLSAAAGAHAAAASVQRNDGAIAEAVAGSASVLAELEVAGQPRRLAAPAPSGESNRWAVPATVRMLVFDGRRVEASAAILVLGGADWGRAAPGQRFRTTGKLRPPGPGDPEAGLLSATSAPVRLSAAAGGALAPAGLRQGFSAAAAGLPGDAAGLLPGMVTGETAALDPQLAAAMKTVGMTHLTAVSGANCSLVLGALLLAARSLRLPRPAAAALALAGLGLFVLMVGPEASVLRAACMGAAGLSALAAGRSGRGLSLLCLAAIGLLLGDPALATDFGFLLSVLATLGIIVAGGPVMGWLPAAVPRPVAAGLAVPLAAQLFCGPVIVLLQPQFSSYALFANLAAAALVVPVTLFGTAAVPLVALVPGLATVPLGIAGMFAGGVAGIARYFAALPGAALPWPEGALGLSTMTVLSTLSLSVLWLCAHPAATWRRVLTIQEHTALGLSLFLDRKAPTPGAEAGRRRRDRRGRRGQRGLVDRFRRGRLRVCKTTSRRNHQWLLPRPNAPGPRRRTPPPGAM